jgi:hypothetical protein
LVLFKSVQKGKKIDQMQCFVDSQAFNASESHDKSVRKLNSFRNDFIHFVPKGWTLELTGLPRICLTTSVNTGKYSEKQWKKKYEFCGYLPDF